MRINGCVAMLMSALLLTSCRQEAAPAPISPLVDRPQRIVSLDFCADQYVLKLADRDQIIALSPDAESEFSYMRAQAAGLKRVRPTAEAVLALKPDLIVRTYGGGPGAAEFYAAAGVKVAQIPHADDFAGVRAAAVAISQAVGHPQRGQKLAAEINQRLAAAPAQGPTALYVTPGGVTTGGGSLIDAIIQAGGFRNYTGGTGWRDLPLEQLTRADPDLIIASFFDARQPQPWSSARHPVARRLMQERPFVAMDGAVTACGGWFVLDAVEQLRAARTQMEQNP